jgi:hypothetical protein
MSSAQVIKRDMVIQIDRLTCLNVKFTNWLTEFQATLNKNSPFTSQRTQSLTIMRTKEINAVQENNRCPLVYCLFKMQNVMLRQAVNSYHGLKGLILRSVSNILY